MLHSVGKGSKEKPVFVHMEYTGNSKGEKYSYIGKGLLFDAGGLNIKTSGMEDMWMDKAGAMSVFSAFK